VEILRVPIETFRERKLQITPSFVVCKDGKLAQIDLLRGEKKTYNKNDSYREIREDIRKS